MNEATRRDKNMGDDARPHKSSESQWKPEFWYEDPEIIEPIPNGPGVLEKYIQMDRDRRRIKDANLSPDEAKIFLREGGPPGGGRICDHLLRLIGRPGAERDFALAYAQHGEAALKIEKQETSKAITQVIGGEGVDPKMFWTFAPYLLKCLKEKGIPDREAISRILLWSQDGVSGENFEKLESAKLRSGKRVLYSDDWHHNHLKGLEKFHGEGWILTEDPHDYVHKFTEREAKRIVEEIFLDKDGGQKEILTDEKFQELVAEKMSLWHSIIDDAMIDEETKKELKEKLSHLQGHYNLRRLDTFDDIYGRITSQYTPYSILNIIKRSKVQDEAQALFVNLRDDIRALFDKIRKTYTEDQT